MSLTGTAAKLLASLDLDTKPFERGEKRIGSSMGRMETRMSRVSTRAIATGSAIGTGIERLAEKGIDVLFDSLRSGEVGLQKLQDAQAQTAAVIESTGGKAGITAAKVRELAEAQEELTTVDDKIVQSGENMLLTFTNIGKDVFPQATKAMVDMAVAMNGGNAETVDLKTTAIQLGKALNDPIKGVTALKKVGVSFTAAQMAQIKVMVEAGDVAGAQKVILAELATEFGKAGEAAGKSGAAGIRRLNDAVEDTQITLATGLSPALERIRGRLAKALNDPGTQDAVKHLGEWLGDAAEKGIEFASKIPWGQVADGLKTAAGFAGKLVDVFVNMPPAVQGSILALAGLNKISGGAVTSIVGELGKGLIKGVLGMNAGVVNLNAGVVNGAGGAGGAAGGGGSSLATGVIGTAGAAAVLAGGTLAIQDIQSGTEEGVKRGLLTAAGGFPAMIGRAVGEAIGDPIGDFLRSQEKTNTTSSKTIADIATKDRSLEARDAEDTQARLAALRNSIESENVRTRTRIDAGASKTASQTRTSGQGIIGAIRALDIRPIVTVPVSVTVRGSLATATWISRATRLTNAGIY